MKIPHIGKNQQYEGLVILLLILSVAGIVFAGLGWILNLPTGSWNQLYDPGNPGMVSICKTIVYISLAVLVFDIIFSLLAQNTIKVSGNDYWYVEESGEFHPAEHRRYWFGDLRRLVKVSPRMCFTASAQDSWPPRYVNFVIEMPETVDEGTFSTFMGWYQGYKSMWATYNDLRVFFDGWRERADLPFTLTKKNIPVVM